MAPVRAAPASGFALVAHADWSGAQIGAAPKRQAAVALREGRGWWLDPPAPVGSPQAFLDRILDRAAPGAALLGVDFPIGLPVGFAERHLPGIAGFAALLDRIEALSDSGFLTPASRLEEVSGARPFFPAGAVRGQGLKALHADRLGLAAALLLRVCDRAGPGLRPACGLFWTLGSNQVGKAAVSGWRELLGPARIRLGARLRLWPFSGELLDAGPGSLTIAETYPAEAYPRLGLPARTAKRDPLWRAAQAPWLLGFAEREGVRLANGLVARIADGFGPGPAGEDAFDATVAVLGMLPVARGALGCGAPDRWAIRTWEGWMLGRGHDPEADQVEAPPPSLRA